MATVIADRAKASFPVFGQGYGNCNVAYGSYTLADGDEDDGDIIELCKLPANCTVVGGYLIAGDMDTGTEALDIDLGWAANGNEAADPDGLVNSGVLTGDGVAGLYAAGGNFRLFDGLVDGFPTFTAETTIQAEANAPAATFAAGVLSVVVFYVMN